MIGLDEHTMEHNDHDFSIRLSKFCFSVLAPQDQCSIITISLDVGVDRLSKGLVPTGICKV